MSMRKECCHIIVFLLLSMLCLPVMGADNLSELDEILSKRKEYEARKRADIDKARHDYATASTDSDRYNTLRTLYKEYRSFRIDSALIIADERLDIARRMGTQSKIASASINLAESYLKSGFPDKALVILDTLGRSSLEDYHRKYLLSVYKNAYMLKGATEILPEAQRFYKEKVRALRDTSLSQSPRQSRAYYMLQAEKFMDQGMHSRAVRKIEEADSLFDFSGDAAMQFTMGEIYLADGQRKKAIDCLAKAAALDLSSGTKEYRALILLASILFEEGDVERAFVYINCALEDVHFSNANFRNPEIMESMPVIDQAFHAYESKEKQTARTFLWIAASLILLLVVSILLLWRTLRSNRRMLATIEKINSRLEERNRMLEDADSLKLKNINTLIMSNAHYIERLKQYRKTVYRLVKTGQYEKALEALKNDRNDSRDISEFHEMFDETFISMFPNFLDDVNKLMKEPLHLKTNNRLTPELRVMALMRLGLSSTDEIAGILHYTSQSVYNLRSTIRAMSALPREEFEKALADL